MSSLVLLLLGQTVNNQSCCDKAQVLSRKIFQYIRSLNLFPSSPPSIDAYDLTTERISTRIYIILLIICFLILLSYKATDNVIKTVIFKAPSFNEYQNLYEKQNEKLLCPCSTITSEYKTFLYIKPLFHQLCTSDFVSEKWINAET
jgi:hypothetical protein